MSPYCQDSETSLVDRVGGQWPEIGFSFPVNPDKPIPANKEYTISDAFVLFSLNNPDDNLEVTERYLDHLAAIYRHLPKPEIGYSDWSSIAEKSLVGLTNHKGCWQQIEGHAYLNAYMGDYQTPAESMVQLAVLLPLSEYLEWRGQDHPMRRDIEKGLAAFYDEELGTLVRWHPARRDDLDQSEEQKREHVMDSWYLHHPLFNLARLAHYGDSAARKLFLDSLDYVIKVAHHFDYDWPVFYRMTTLEALKPETEPGEGGEKDVPGSYALLMVLAWQLTGESRFLTEAKRAVKKLEIRDFDIFYQANNTAFSAGALVELYKETGEELYLKLSYCCIAGLMRNVSLWDCRYGNIQEFPNFFAIYPLNDAPYTAAYEEFEVFYGIHHYLKETRELPIPQSIKLLLSEFIRYATGRLVYYFPAMLPEDAISDEVKTGEIDRDLWVPLEDIQDGWEPSGTVGQEVYGAGLAFGIVPRQYFRLGYEEVMIFVDYPVTSFRKSGRSVTFRTLGLEESECNLRLIGAGRDQLKQISVEIKSGRSYVPAEKKKAATFQLRGGSLIRIRW